MCEGIRKLLELCKEYPDLPLVPLVDKELFFNEEKRLHAKIVDAQKNKDAIFVKIVSVSDEAEIK